MERELEEITTLAGDNPEYLWKIKNLKYTLAKLKSDQNSIDILSNSKVIAEGIIRYVDEDEPGIIGDYYFKGTGKSICDILIENKAFGKPVKLILQIDK